MKKRLFVFFIFLSVSFFSSAIEGIYRPLTLVSADAVSTSAGGAGVSSINSISTLNLNPSFAGRLNDPSFSLGFTSKLIVSGFLNYPDIQFSNYPDLSYAMPAPYGGAGIMLFKSFENSWAANAFTIYNIEVLYSLNFLKDFSVGISVGAAMGLQDNLMDGAGFSSSISGLWKTDKISAGILVRPPVQLSYSSYYGIPVVEVTPTRVQAGATIYFNNWSLILELDYIDWYDSSYKENGKEIRPAMQTGFLDFFHPHIGIDIDFTPVALHWRAGIYTADDFDNSGFNSRQILVTTGVYFHPVSDGWGEKFRIDFSYTSGFLFSAFFNENYPIDRVSLNLNFAF